MNIELTAPTRGVLHEHISSPPALPVCFDSSGLVSMRVDRGPLDFVVGINAIAWGESNEIYPYPSREEAMSEWASVGHSVPAVLSRWHNYGLFGTNIEGWFPLDPRNTDGLLRAIALFGSVLWIEQDDIPWEGRARVLCGFHRNLGVNSLDAGPGMSFEYLNTLGVEAYVVIPTILAETDHRSLQYIRYNTLETF